MTSAPINPLDVPPYQLQPLIDSVNRGIGRSSTDGLPAVEVRCAQAIGSEIYVGCSNGQLLRFALQANGPDEPESYSLLSRQALPSPKPIDEIVLTPSISRALVLCDRQIHLFTLPNLDVVPGIKPIRNVQAFAVDHQHMLRPAPPLTDPPLPVEPVDFCIVKRSGIVLYSLREQLVYLKEMPLPGGAVLARRTGPYLCIAGPEEYSIVNLNQVSLTPIMPISQAPPDAGGPRVRPIIVVISEFEFLILSWNGASTMGLFITGDADPTRGTLEWPSHPMSVCLDYPYVTALLPNQTIEVHNVESQAIAQVVAAPPLPSPSAAPTLLTGERRSLIVSQSGFLVPSKEQSEKLRLVKVMLLGRTANPGGRTGDELQAKLADLEDESFDEKQSDAEEEVQELEIPEPAPYDV